MKKLTYKPRNNNTTKELRYGTPSKKGLVLRQHLPSLCDEEDFMFLQENSEEFKLCIDAKIIEVETGGSKNKESLLTPKTPEKEKTEESPDSIPGTNVKRTSTR